MLIQFQDEYLSETGVYSMHDIYMRGFCFHHKCAKEAEIFTIKIY